MSKFSFTVKEDVLKKIGSRRLDTYVSSELETQFPNQYSRTLVGVSIKNGLCKLNSKVLRKQGSKVEIGDSISISIDLPKTEIVPDENVNFKIIYEDDEVIVIDKPRGLVVHPAPSVKESTLVHGLYAKINKQTFIDEGDELFRLGIVHRLDRETSGLMVVAKSMQAKKVLQMQLKPPRTMKRVYHAITFGEMRQKRGLSLNSKGGLININAPLVRDKKNRIKYTVDFLDNDSRESETNFRVLKRSNLFSLVECHLVTGRTHQIRAHLEYIGLPILGDKVYKPNLSKTLLSEFPSISTLRGQLLHAKYLSFIHPKTKEELSFESLYPEDFLEVQESLKL